MFLQQPPAWRSLCKELKPHSTRKIRNIESHQFDGVSRTTLDGPEAFCHVSPDADEDKRYDEKCLPKTLVCHDMANGYHDDCIIDGTGNYDAYTFYNWAGIDIFCYFSHHLITIPPLGWINVGHDHGVKVIGTVITEWADGIEFWEEVLETEEEYKNFANALVVIAKTLKFDGWLLNVENKIAKPDMLLEFVKHLHALLHQELADPVLIWYDSVTVEGHLNWQNALNHKNRAFFDACDGIFTNYSWTEEDVEASAREAGDRVRDLFIGIDVWGRNFYGGGQFNVQEAVEVAALQGCSLAVFAPAWTHEALSLQQSDVNAVALCDLPAYQHFLLRDRALWDSVWRYLATRLPCRLPFATSFCRGQGLTRRLYGEVICPVPWYNLRHMQYQPNTSHGPHGYLLSTIENIATASRTGILKDPNGIIKYRASMLENKLEEDEAPPEKAEDDADDAPAGLVPRADSTGELPAAADHADQADDADADHSAEGVESKPSKISLKRKMKNVFKHIFHRKNDYDAQQAAETGDRSKAPEWRVLEPIPEQSSEPELGPSKTANGRDPDPASGGKVDLDAGKPTTETDAEPSEPSRRKKQRPEFDEAVKVAEGEEARADETDEEATGEDAPTVLHGRSMVQMSVQLKLKAKDARTRFGLASVPDERQCLEVHLDDAFIGGSCLKVNPSDEHSREHRTVRLLQCEFPCEARLVFCVVTKKVVGHEEQFLNVDVHLRERGAAEDRVVLVGRDVAQAAAAHAPGFIAHVAPVGAADPRHLRDLQRYILLNEPGFYIPIENSYNWTVRYYEVDLPGAVVTSINLATGLSSGPILLGYFGICARRSDGDND